MNQKLGGGSFHPLHLPILPLPVFSLLPNPDPHRFSHEESTACLWSLPLEFPPTAENRDRISSQPPCFVASREETQAWKNSGNSTAVITHGCSVGPLSLQNIHLVS